jgi:hypothetical protein
LEGAGVFRRREQGASDGGSRGLQTEGAGGFRPLKMRLNPRALAPGLSFLLPERNMGSERPEKPPPGLKPRLDRDHFKGLKTPAPSVRSGATPIHKILEINPRGEAALKSFPTLPQKLSS